jgi:hypothetical protein
MNRRPSLRLRVALAFAGMGAALSLLLTMGIWFAAHDVSQRLMDQTLKAELEDYMARRARNPNSLPPATASLRGYLAKIGGGRPEDCPGGAHPAARPARNRARRHSLSRCRRRSRRQPLRDPVRRGRQKRREQRFLAYLVAGALLMTLLAAVGGLWLAGRVIAPVTELARTPSAAPQPDRPPRLGRTGGRRARRRDRRPGPYVRPLCPAAGRFRRARARLLRRCQPRTAHSAGGNSRRRRGTGRGSRTEPGPARARRPHRTRHR